MSGKDNHAAHVAVLEAMLVRSHDSLRMAQGLAEEAGPRAQIAALHAAIAAMKQQGWQPIETAPKDGAEFQAWIGEWEPRCRFNDDGVFQIWGRVDYDMDGWDFYPAAIPTHWMPIPTAPTEASR